MRQHRFSLFYILVIVSCYGCAWLKHLETPPANMPPLTTSNPKLSYNVATHSWETVAVAKAALVESPLTPVAQLRQIVLAELERQLDAVRQKYQTMFEQATGEALLTKSPTTP